MSLQSLIARSFRLTICLVAVFGIAATAASADPPALHVEIDRQIDGRLAELKVEPAAQSDDAEFVRRVYLDLNGVIPTAAEARAFLDDKTADKRARLIDRLLDRPDYALHMARVFDVFLSERRIPTITSYDVTTANWRSYLAEAFAENRPWNRMAGEILSADGAGKRLEGALKFYLVRDAEPHQLTRDVGRLFLGVDLQCAQCHDDPRVEEYHQADYYGIYAFLQRVKLHPTQPRGALVAETADGVTKFTSVFTAKSGETNPRIPGDEMIADPKLEKGKEYVVKPGAKEPGVPTYSRRKKLAERLPRPETRGFARNIANRIWANMLGRGIVHPVDLHHADNAPSHPELLDLLSQRVVDNHFDLKDLVREIALSKAYQRSSRLPKGIRELPDDAFAVAPLRGLTAEQLRWSILQATGRVELQLVRYDEQRAKKPTPTGGPTATDWKSKATALEPLERQSAALATAFAGLPGQADGPFQPVVDQTLFLLNNPQFSALIAAAPDTRLAELLKTDRSEALAEELYLAIFARRPSAEEIAEVRALSASSSDPKVRSQTLDSLLRGLLLSAEFRLNH
jgi:hypothetical protein